MMIQAQISLYPLGNAAFGDAINAFIRGLKSTGLETVSDTMSTTLSGDSASVLPALQHAFEEAAAGNAVVMVVKVSNACPAIGSNARE